MPGIDSALGPCLLERARERRGQTRERPRPRLPRRSWPPEPPTLPDAPDAAGSPCPSVQPTTAPRPTSDDTVHQRTRGRTRSLGRRDGGTTEPILPRPSVGGLPPFRRV